MARTTIIETVDDLNGGPADQLVKFALDGAHYEIDLNSDNADTLRQLLDPFVTHGRRTGGRQRRSQAEPTRNSREWLSNVRDWARNNGFTVSDRGRIPKAVRAAYAKAHD